ncbi:aldehyde dehydrogenase family protein, partial [Kineococcus sp. T13]|uniref:aldehyde dehydrogenase family protein n=1 Tax=Kineococcus vitellinus TaxID=2696565 RepID=UPI0014132EA7
LLRPRPAAAAGAARLAALLEEAGLPPGLVATAPGADAATDARLWAHRELVAVRADGGAQELRALALALAPAGVPLVGRTDGPAVHVVLAGADLAAVLPVLLAAVAGGAHEHPGGTRVLVARGLADTLVRRLGPAVRRLRVGDPLE